MQCWSVMVSYEFLSQLMWQVYIYQNRNMLTTNYHFYMICGCFRTELYRVCCKKYISNYVLYWYVVSQYWSFKAVTHFISYNNLKHCCFEYWSLTWVCYLEWFVRNSCLFTDGRIPISYLFLQCKQVPDI